MTETQYLAKLLHQLRPRVGKHGVVFKHQDARTTGIPDFSVTLAGFTSWWETKLAKRGKIIGLGLQHQTMRELAVAGKALYIVWDETGVSIVQPKHIFETGLYHPTLHEVVNCTQFLVEFILKLHTRPQISIDAYK